MALLLSGCIDPSAPAYSPNGTVATIPAVPNPTTPTPNRVTNSTSQPSATIAPLTPLATPPPQALPLSPDGVWAKTPVGPESVNILFFHNPPNSGPPCIGYVFRNTLVSHCATSGQPLALVTGTIQPADNKQYTLIAGRTLSGQVSGVSIEFADGTSTSTPISPGGFALVLNGIHKPLDVVPIDQYGNLVASKVPF